jgi:hypothetical protein
MWAVRHVSAKGITKSMRLFVPEPPPVMTKTMSLTLKRFEISRFDIAEWGAGVNIWV